MRIATLLIFYMLIGCGPRDVSDYLHSYSEDDKDPRLTLSTDEEFLPQIKLFEEISGRKVINIPVNFSEIESDDSKWRTIGQCITYMTPNKIFKEVVIDGVFWDSATEDEKEVLILHELGHCVLNRPHTTDKIDYENFPVPSSIMNPFIIGGYFYYAPNKDYYHKELVNGRR